MSIFRTLQQNPTTLLSLAVLAMIAWVSVDLARPPKSGVKKADGLDDVVLAAPILGIQSPPIPAGESNAGVLAASLQKLRPGMTRLEVERLLGIPAGDRVEPVTSSDGRLTYRTAYELAESSPMTIRPIRPLPRVIGAQEHSAPLVALEFDASRPGHPLVDILYLDPLF